MYEPIKKLGQNFLTDFSIVNKMINLLDIKGHEVVVEIGPGLGVLTEELAKVLDRKDAELIAVEIDERLSTKVNEMFLYHGHVFVVNEDILKWLKEFEPEGDYKILGSLPFYITSPILHTIIKAPKMAVKCVLLVQKEVAEKLAAEAPDTSYLSAFVQTFYDIEYAGEVPRKKFKPEPSVDGAIVKLTKRAINMDPETILKYEGFLHRGFQSPRKMLNKPFKKEELDKGSIDPSIRPQNLSADQWLDFFKVLQS